MEPEEAAKLVVLDALHERPEVFVAMVFLSLIDSDALHAYFGDALVVDDPVAAILAAAPALPPPPTRRTYEIVTEARTHPGRLPIPERSGPVSPMDLGITRWTNRARPSPEQAEQARSAFSKWVEGDIPYYPGVAGAVD